MHRDGRPRCATGAGAGGTGPRRKKAKRAAGGEAGESGGAGEQGRAPGSPTRRGGFYKPSPAAVRYRRERGAPLRGPGPLRRPPVASPLGGRSGTLGAAAPRSAASFSRTEQNKSTKPRFAPAGAVRRADPRHVEAPRYFLPPVLAHFLLPHLFFSVWGFFMLFCCCLFFFFFSDCFWFWFIFEGA